MNHHDELLIEALKSAACGEQDEHWKVEIGFDLNLINEHISSLLKSSSGGLLSAAGLDGVANRRVARSVLRIIRRVKNFEGIK